MTSLNKHKIGCVASFCNSLFGNKNNILFYNFPENPITCQKWIEFSEQPELKKLNVQKVQSSKQYRLCSLHFNKEQYYNNTNSLRFEAIPTVKTIFKQNKISDISLSTGNKSYVILVEDETMNIKTDETDNENSVKNVLKINSKPFIDVKNETNIEIKEDESIKKYNLRTNSKPQDYCNGNKSNRRSITKCSISKNKDKSCISLIKNDKTNVEIEKKNIETLKQNNSECLRNTKKNEYNEVPGITSYLNIHKIQSCFVLVKKLNIKTEEKNIKNLKENYLNNNLKPSEDSTRKNKIEKILVSKDSENENDKGNIKVKETNFENCKTNYLEDNFKRSHKILNQNQTGVILAEKSETNSEIVKNNFKSCKKNNLNDNSNSPEEHKMKKFSEILTTECLRNENKPEHETNRTLVKENDTNTKIKQQNSENYRNISKRKISDKISIKSNSNSNSLAKMHALNEKINLLDRVLKELESKSDASSSNNSDDSVIDMEDDELDNNSSNSDTTSISSVGIDYDSINSDSTDTESRTANDKTLNNQFDLVNYLETFNKSGRSATNTLINRLSNTQTYQCDICCKKFRLKKSYKNHMVRVHVDKPIFHCNKCTERFGTLKQLERHEESKHSDPQKYICSKCPKIFTKLSNLTTHEKIHNGKIYRCNICSKEFPVRLSLQKHMRTHLNRKYSCQYCVKTFATIMSVQMHEQLHKNDKPYLCDECPTQFKVVQQLRRHKECHKRLKVESENFLCDMCAAVLKTKKSLHNHKLIHKNEKKYVCDICDQRFFRHDNLQNHLRRHTGEKQHECDRCDENFTRICDLEKHRLHVHNVESLYRCKICLCEFLTIYELRKHRITHLTHIRYQLRRTHRQHKLKETTSLECQICNRMFKSNFMLKEHIRKHTGERPYECKVCPKTFYLLSAFAQHQQVHTDVRQYQCSVCPKAFKRKSFLIQHERIHTGEKPYKCRVCSRSFTQSGDCKMHERRLHPNTCISTVPNLGTIDNEESNQSVKVPNLNKRNGNCTLDDEEGNQSVKVPNLNKINGECTIDDEEGNQSVEVLNIECDVQLHSNASAPILYEAAQSDNSNNSNNIYIEDDFKNIEVLDEDFELYNAISSIINIK